MVHRLLRCSLLLTLVVGAIASHRATPLAAQSPQPSPRQLAITGQTGGDSSTMVVAANAAYVGIGPRIATYDLSNPDQPSLHNQSSILPATVQDLALGDGYLYAALGYGREHGLATFSLATPLTPTLVSFYQLELSAMAVFSAQNYVYVQVDDGLKVFDLTNPRQPKLVNQLNKHGIANVTIQGNQAFLNIQSWLSGFDSLDILDLSEPMTPTLKGSITLGDILDIEIASDVAYVNTQLGLRVVDIRDPSNPSIINQTDDVAGLQLAVSDNTLAMIGLDYALHTWDITNPITPTEIAASSETILGWPTNLIAKQQRGYVLTRSGQLNVFDWSNRQAPTRINTTETPGCKENVALQVVGDYAYVADWGRGLCIVDLRNPNQPTVVGRFDLTTDRNAVSDIAVQGSLVYMVDWSHGIYVIDVSDPTEPTQVSFFATAGLPAAIAVNGPMVYVGESINDQGFGGSVRIFDLTDLDNPVEHSQFYTSKVAQLVVVDQTLYVADNEGGLRILDVRDPDNIQMLGQYADTWFAMDVAIQNDLAFVATTAGLEIVDISDATQPTAVSRVESGLVDGVVVADDQLYIGVDGGIQQIDIRQPSNPQIVANLLLARDSWILPALHDEAIVALSYHGGGMFVIREQHQLFLPVVSKN